MIRVGVIGYGYWGPGIVRNFHGVEGCEVAMVCDRSASALKRAKQAYPSLEVTNDPCDVLSARGSAAVAVVTPVWTHFVLAVRQGCLGARQARFRRKTVHINRGT